MSIEPKKLSGPGAGAVSDLFFNTDFDGCKIMGPSGFEGYDETKLRQEADAFANNIEALNPSLLYTADELIADLYARM